MLNMTTLEDNECVPRRGGGKSKSLVSELMDVPKSLKEDIKSMIAMIALLDAEIAALKAATAKRGQMGIGSEKELCAEIATLQERVKKLKAKTEALTVKNEELTQQILKAYANESGSMKILLR